MDRMFHFCKECPAKKNCCTGKTVDLPVLTPIDVSNICKRTGLSPGDFTVSGGEKLLNMRPVDGRCFFYRKEKCTIYEARPFDCKLFPFDIRKNEKGKLILVWYSTACPNPIDIEPYKEKINALLPSLNPYLEEFALQKSPLLDSQEYNFLRTLP